MKKVKHVTLRMSVTCSSIIEEEKQLLLLVFTIGSHDLEGGLKTRKIYKKLGMSSNPCSHDLANCHAKEPR